jgi:acyl-CoA thioesterase
MLTECNFAADHGVDAPMEPGYGVFKGAFGGWTAAHALLAAQGVAPSPLEPVALSIDYLGAILPGSVLASPTIVQETRSMRFIAVRTMQEAALRASSTVVMAARRDTARVDAATIPACAPAESVARFALEGGPNTWLQRFDMRCVLGKPLRPNPNMRTLTWTRLLDTSPNDHAAITAIADASIPRIFFHFDHITPIATVTLSIHYHANSAELATAMQDFVLVDSAAHAARHGFFDQQVRIWSRTGVLLATSTQMARYDVAVSRDV